MVVVLKDANYEYVKKTEKKGVLDKTMYSQVNEIDGLMLKEMFETNIIKFMFLITQYCSGKIPMNEPIVASSINVPQQKVNDLYILWNQKISKIHRRFIK